MGAESREGGQNAEEGGTENEGAKALRAEMPQQRNRDNRQRADARALIQERPGTVREQGLPVGLHASAGSSCAAEVDGAPCGSAPRR